MKYFLTEISVTYENAYDESQLFRALADSSALQHRKQERSRRLSLRLRSCFVPASPCVWSRDSSLR
ncbi:hypothetical protein SPHV1_2260131 [Novosphingobium sp. KN65.2]|nr:hypothetical protein SPHV1_2260131 [Novosphingobium sp. KN65.2]